MDDDIGCDLCGGEDHETRFCQLLVGGARVEDAHCPSRAILTVPSNLRIKMCRSRASDGEDAPNDYRKSIASSTVQARENVPANTRFGPFEAPRTVALNATAALPLRIFLDDGTSVFLDSTDEKQCNWMCLVQPAQSHADHNLIALQLSEDIFFVAKRDIRIHEELRVWYAPHYGRKMGIQQPPWPTSVETSDGLLQDVSSTKRPTKKRKKLLEAALEVAATNDQPPPHDLLPRRTLRRRTVKVWKEYIENSKEEEEDGGMGPQNAADEETDEKADQCRKLRRRKGVDLSNKKCSNRSAVCPFCTRQFASANVLLKHQSRCRSAQLSPSATTEDHEVTGEVGEDVDAATAVSVDMTYGTETEVSVIIVDDGTGETNRAVLRLLQDGDNIYVTGGDSNETNVVGADIIASGEILMEAMQEIDANIATTEHPYSPLSASPKLPNRTDELQSGHDRLECTKCQNVFTTEEELATHTCTSRRPSTTTFVCSRCGENFDSNCLLKRHLAKDAGEQRVCGECGKSYCTERLLRAHICRRSSPNADGLFCCNICHKTFTKLKYLDKHTPIHTGNHACQICGKWLRSRDSLQNHMRICGQVKELEQNGSAQCSHCKRLFTDICEFRRHLYEHTHLFQCDKCAARFRNKVNLKCHVCTVAAAAAAAAAASDSTVTDQPDMDSAEATTTTTIIQSSSSASMAEAAGDSSALEENEEVDGPSTIPEGEDEDYEEEEEAEAAATDPVNPANTINDKLKPFVCDVCGSIFSSTSSLNVHKRLHGEKLFGCGECGKRFHRKDMLADHCAMHGEPTVPCPVCEKRFKTKKSLDVHLLLHDGRKRFSCQTCNKQFYQRGNLMKHEEVHNDRRRHPCPTCTKEFSTKEYLVIHMLEHTSGRKYACSECGKSFVKEHQLKAHQRTLHTNLVYVCKFCGRNIKLKHSLKRHLIKKHADQQHLWNSSENISDMLMLFEDRIQAVTQTECDDRPSAETPPPPPTHTSLAHELQEQSLAEPSLEADYDSSNAVLEGGEVLLAVTGIESEALQQALESGSACIRPGATPNTIEISLPVEHPAIQEVIAAETVESISSTYVHSEELHEVETAVAPDCSDYVHGNEMVEREADVEAAEDDQTDEIPIVDELDLSEGTIVLENGTILRQGVSADGSRVLFYVLTADEHIATEEVDEEDGGERDASPVPHD